MPSLWYIGMMLVSMLMLFSAHTDTLVPQVRAIEPIILRSQRLLLRNSRNATLYYRLGDAYIQKARESGDITYIKLAEEALQKCLEIAPAHSGAARHLAYAMYMRHGFDEAARQAQRAIELEPRD